MDHSSNSLDQSIRYVYKQNRMLQYLTFRLKQDRIKIAEDLEQYIYKKTNIVFLAINKENTHSKFLDFAQYTYKFNCNGCNDSIYKINLNMEIHTWTLYKTNIIIESSNKLDVILTKLLKDFTDTK